MICAAMHEKQGEIRIDRPSVNPWSMAFLPGQLRIRDVHQGPDGYIYLVTDNRAGGPTPIVRFEPVE